MSLADTSHSRLRFRRWTGSTVPCMGDYVLTTIFVCDTLRADTPAWERMITTVKCCTGCLQIAYAWQSCCIGAHSARPLIVQLHVQVVVRAGGTQLAEGGATDNTNPAQNDRTTASAPAKPAKKGTPWLYSFRGSPSQVCLCVPAPAHGLSAHDTHSLCLCITSACAFSWMRGSHSQYFSLQAACCCAHSSGPHHVSLSPLLFFRQCLC